jgi:hypothetical protein
MVECVNRASKGCPREAIPGYSKCEPCLNKNVVYMRNKRAKDRVYAERELIINNNRKDRYEAEGRCRRCSKKMNPDTDMKYKECLNCRERKRYDKI